MSPLRDLREGVDGGFPRVSGDEPGFTVAELPLA